MAKTAVASFDDGFGKLVKVLGWISSITFGLEMLRRLVAFVRRHLG